MVKRSDKRADLIIYPIILTVLNLLFVGILIFFVFNSGRGAGVYEQMYAKQIALMLDSAEPYTVLKVDFKEGFDIAEGNKLSKSKMDGLVKIDERTSNITVSLTDGKGYSLEYFSNYPIKVKMDDINKLAIITLGEENDEK